MRFSSCVLLLFVAISSVAAPQTPVVPHAAESVEVSIVNVDAVVVDKQGKRVQGLLRDDFEIFENGVRQPITNFAEYTSTVPQQPSGVVTAQIPAGAPQPPPPQRRSIIVFVERFQLPAFRSDPMFAAMKKLLHDSVRPGDRVMVVSWNQGIVGVRQTFTDDLSKVDKALDEIASRTKTRSHDPMDDLRQELSTLQDPFGGGRAAIEDSGLSFSREQSARMKAEIAMADEKRKVETLKALMRSMAGVEGRKVLLLATHRLSEYAGAEAFYLVDPGQLPAEVQSEFDAKPLIGTLIETANANGVTIYPIYAEGLGSTTLPSADQSEAPAAGSGAFDYRILSNETPMLEFVAKETGGVAAWGSTDVTKLLPRIGDDFDSYYSLAYRATSTKAAARKVEVRVKDPALSVRARRQFVPKNETTRMEDRVIGALFGNAPRSAFRFAAKSGEPTRTKKKTYLFPLTVQVPIAALTPLRGQGNVYNGAFSVYVAWGSMIGGVSDTHHDTQQFSIPVADLDKAKTGHFTYTVSVESLTPSLRVALGIYDEVSHDYAVGLINLQPPPAK
ncbi:MAG TPA: VWA domain-containing protein [Thermoanaerobaculia bacterium]|jgi:VWFA-related protein|nr:VWA domain-containing protein [Thermoanaerobaculia bacterium]